MVFTNLICMKKHFERIHENITNFDCKLCDKSFYSKKDFDYHFKRNHGEGFKKIKCEFCEREILAGRGMRLHVERVHTNKDWKNNFK